MCVHMDVPVGTYTRTRMKCGLQGHMCAHLSRWMASWSRLYLPGHRPLGSKDVKAEFELQRICRNVSPARSCRVKPARFDLSLSPCSYLFCCSSEFGVCTRGWRGRPVLQCRCTRIKKTKGRQFPGLQCEDLIMFQNNWSYKLMGHLKCYLVPNMKCSSSALRGH